LTFPGASRTLSLGMRRLIHSVLSFLILATLAPGTGVTICEAANHFGLDVHHHADRGPVACVGGHHHEQEEHGHTHGHDHGHEHSPSPSEDDCEHIPCSESCFSDLSEAPLPKGEAIPQPPTPVSDLPAIHSAEPDLPAALRSRLDRLHLQPPDRLPALKSRSFTGRFLI